jgi:hypothetical protein
MNHHLTGLGVPAVVQAFFDTGDLCFRYGDDYELFGAGFHRVPTTPNLWIAGKELSREVVITSSAMEAIAYLSVNLYRYPDLDNLSFIATGNLPNYAQLNWVRSNYPNQKFTLVFGRYLLGRLADIMVAAGLKHHRVKMTHMGQEIQISYRNILYTFGQDRLSLSAFEKAARLRTDFRTHKPKGFNTYLEQLKYHAKQ